MDLLCSMMQKNVGYSFLGVTFVLIRPDYVVTDCVGEADLDTFYDVASLTKIKISAEGFLNRNLREHNL